MDDISNELLNKIQKEFQSGFNKSDKISKLYKKIRDGTATYQEANAFAIETGNILANAYKKYLSSDVLPDGKMYYNIAKKILGSTLKNNYELICDVAKQVQEQLNKNAGLGIKAISPELNRDRIDGLIRKVSDADNYDDVAWVLDEPVKNFSQNIVDDSIKTNAEFQAQAGLVPKIIRKVAGDCCDWCKAIAGTYTYPNVPKDVYRRHQRCRCMVDYYPGDGKVQNVHSKKWISEEENAKIELRKKVGTKKKSPQKRIVKTYGLKNESIRKEKRIENSKKLTAKDLDRMSLKELRTLTQKIAAEYYKTGKSGISFGEYDVEKAAELLVQGSSRASLKKDILAIQRKMKVI